jgi:hypothetical protein
MEYIGRILWGPSFMNGYVPRRLLEKRMHAGWLKPADVQEVVEKRCNRANVMCSVGD